MPRPYDTHWLGTLIVALMVVALFAFGLDCLGIINIGWCEN